MAITVSKYPSALYPAYNDSWVQFTSSLANNNRAEITITGMPVFTLYPINGVYLINLKEIVKAKINTVPFNDTLSVGIPWGYTVPSNYLSLPISIKVYSDIADETLSRTYTFFRNVKQIGDSIYNNNGQVLLPSDNGIDFNATYWEGFPFDFSIQRVSTRVNIKNKNSNQTSPNITFSGTHTLRVVVDKGANNNWTMSGYLPLTQTVNRLEILEGSGGTFRSNLNLKKLKKACGVYLKWFNSEGGYSYFLFDEFYKENTSTGSLGMVSQNNFLNIDAVGLSGTKKSMGKIGNKSLELKATVNGDELKHLESMFTSPSVQMYSSQRAYEEGRWIDVEVKSNGFNNVTKKDIQEIKVNIELPEMINTML